MTNRIAELRKARHISQAELADGVEVTRQTIISLENGRYNPSILLAHTIAQYFGMTIEEVFIFDEDEEETINDFILDADIEKAMREASNKFNPSLFGTIEDRKLAFSYLTAFFLVYDLQMAKDGTNRGGPRPGTGPKKKPLIDKINDGKFNTIQQLPFNVDFRTFILFIYS